MRILHLHTKINLACGISKTIFLIANNLKGDFEHKVFSLGGDAVPKFKNAGISISFSKCEKRGALQTIRILNELIQFVKEQKIDIIHSHHRYFDLLAYLISKFISVRTITSVQSEVSGKKYLSYKSEILIACSRSIKKHLIEHFILDEKRIVVIYNFVDMKETNNLILDSMLKEKMSINKDSIIVGFIGRINIKEKGIDILLNSFRTLTQNRKNVFLVLVGNGEDKEFVNNYILSNRLNAVLISSRENVYDYFNIMDVVVLPSRVEPFGIVAIEAGMMKKSVVASNVGGLSEIINDGKNGFLFNSGDSEQLTKKLESIIDNNKMRIDFGEALYSKVIKNFTTDQSIPSYKELYMKLLTKVGRY